MTDYQDSWDADRNGIPDSIQRDPVVAPDDSPAFSEPEPDVGLSEMTSPIEPPVAPTPPPADADEAAIVRYQQQLQEYSRTMQMLSNLQQMEHETRKAIVQNLRR